MEKNYYVKDIINTQLLLFLFTFLVVGNCQNNYLSDGVVEIGYEISSSNTILALNFNPTKFTSEVLFGFFPCFGGAALQIDSYDPTRTVCAQNWDYTQHDQYISCADYSPVPQTTYLIRIDGEISTSPSVQFDFVATTNQNFFNNQVPAPSNTAFTLTSMSGSGSQRTATFQWNPTNNPNDTYTLYQYTGSLSKGVTVSTACGVVKSFTPVNTQITSNNGMMQASISGLTATQTHVITVVVSRPGGYMAVYDSFTLDGPHLQVSKVLILLLCLFFMI
jgi:hypothetical protein